MGRPHWQLSPESVSYFQNINELISSLAAHVPEASLIKLNGVNPGNHHHAPLIAAASSLLSSEGPPLGTASRAAQLLCLSRLPSRAGAEKPMQQTLGQVLP